MGQAPIYLNASLITLDSVNSSAWATDDNLETSPFDENDPYGPLVYPDQVPVQPGETIGPIALFTVSVSPLAQIGDLVIGQFGLDGGEDADTYEFLDELSFEVIVHAIIPEPASISLLALAGICLGHRRRT